MSVLAAKYPTVKFLKSISTTCIPNFPDKNLPTIFIYSEGEMKKQLIGALEFRPALTQDGNYSYDIMFSNRLTCKKQRCFKLAQEKSLEASALFSCLYTQMLYT